MYDNGGDLLVTLMKSLVVVIIISGIVNGKMVLLCILWAALETSLCVRHLNKTPIESLLSRRGENFYVFLS